MIIEIIYACGFFGGVVFSWIAHDVIDYVRSVN